MHADDGGNLRGTSEFRDYRGGRLHAPDCSDKSYTVKRRRSENNDRPVLRFALRLFMLSEWLREVLEKSPISQAALARRMNQEFGLSADRSTVNKMVKGTRKMSAGEMFAISKITGAPVPDARRARPVVPLMGYAAADSDSVIFFGDAQGPLDEVEAPDNATEKTVAVAVRGDSLGPLLNGSTLFYDDFQTPPTADLIGRMCVLGLTSGQVVVKSLYAGQLPNRWNLRANVGPPIYDAEVDWAARIISIRPP